MQSHVESSGVRVEKFELRGSDSVRDGKPVAVPFYFALAALDAVAELNAQRKSAGKPELEVEVISRWPVPPEPDMKPPEQVPFPKDEPPEDAPKD